MNIIRCLHQVFKSKTHLSAFLRGGKGDCSVCTTDDKNKNCPGFYPIAVFTQEVNNNTDAWRAVTKVQSHTTQR